MATQAVGFERQLQILYAVFCLSPLGVVIVEVVWPLGLVGHQKAGVGAFFHHLRFVDMDLTPVGGQTRVSDMNADEGSPHDAGSDTKLPARIQTRSCPPCPLLTEQERRPDRQGAWRLGQLSA